MRAVTFDVTVPGYLLGKALGGVTESVLFGGGSGLNLRDVPEPGLPGRDWVRLEIISSGICGSDLGNITFKSSPAMEPFGSFPAVLGHEIIARVAEVGPDVRRVTLGQRVAVDPVISCAVRGHAPAARCASCALGLHGTCERAGEEGEITVAGRKLRRGLTIGYQADLAGGWGERMVAHESQLLPLDDRISDRTGVLIEPLAVGMHAALGVRPFASGPALVVGSGPIALGTIWALRAAGYEGELVAQIKRGHEAEIARSLGATDVVSPGDEARQALIDTGAQAYVPIVGDEVYSGGGFPLIFDCVGSAETVKQALRYAAPRARIVLLGCAAEIPKLDLTFVWARELEIKGFVCYGREEWRGRERHTFEITQELLIETAAPVERMVTHVYPLAQYREALSTAWNRRRTGSIKVLLDPKAG
jgi:threonine dehydrogenase-like Zn-dependent dehydrogenase